MSNASNPSVLIIGGSGVVGAQAARALRAQNPDLAITLGGRDLAKATAVAQGLGADAVTIDLERRDLGLPTGRAFGAVVVFVKDATLNSLLYAQDTGAAYLDVSSGVFEIGPVVGLAVHRPERSAVLMGSSWLAGVATFPILHFAKAFRTLEDIRIGVVLDEQDMGGPAAFADFERLTTAGPKTQILKDGHWIFAGEADAARSFRDVDGVEVQGQAYSPLDLIDLAATTGARSIRLDMAYGVSASRRRGGAFSTAVILELMGERLDGTRGAARHELVHPRGQGPVTGLGVAVLTERLLGLDGRAPVKPGLYLAGNLVEPAYMLERLLASGLEVAQDVAV